MFRSLALAAPLVLLALPAARPAAAAAEPAYRLLEQDGGFELREYPALLLAEVLIGDADFEEAGNRAFNPLFRYISGNNRARAEIAMTAPVVQEAAEAARGERIAMTAPVRQEAAEGGYRVAFIMPAGYTAETIPEPLDPRVQLRSTAPRLLAALRYSGGWSAAAFARRENELRAELATRGLTAAGEPITARYNAPFVPGPFRRNEVLIPVTRD
ncbi:MAG: heme-binding protein [Gammaproteobacteria bacterium]|nr:heme-binding protein [Gammaproteobacteria bacterium]